jgi:hypothetical protein
MEFDTLSPDPPDKTNGNGDNGKGDEETIGEEHTSISRLGFEFKGSDQMNGDDMQQADKSQDTEE